MLSRRKQTFCEVPWTAKRGQPKIQSRNSWLILGSTWAPWSVCKEQGWLPQALVSAPLIGRSCSHGSFQHHQTKTEMGQWPHGRQRQKCCCAAIQKEVPNTKKGLHIFILLIMRKEYLGNCSRVGCMLFLSVHIQCTSLNKVTQAAETAIRTEILNLLTNELFFDIFRETKEAAAVRQTCGSWLCW